MAGLVIPIKELSPLDMAAVRFAVEYGKRSRVRLLFLFVDDPEHLHSGARPSDPEPAAEDRGAIRKRIETLISKEQRKGFLSLEVHTRRGEFIQEVRQFIRDNHADEIVMPVSDEHSAEFRQVQQNIQLLAQMTHCRILTVKPRTSFEGAKNLE
jgi:nucleotide-binding universal stress UspA family protein